MRFKHKERRRSKIVSLKDVLPEILKEFKIENEFSVETLKNEWSEIIGSIIAAHSMPDRIENNTLYINSDHSVYSNEIFMKRYDILKKINSLFVNSNIKDLRVYIKKIKW